MERILSVHIDHIDYGKKFYSALLEDGMIVFMAETKEELKEEIKRLKEQIRLEREYQERSDFLLQELFKRSLSQEETASTILDQVMDLTGSERGGIFICQGQEMRMVAHRCDSPCIHCSLLDLRKIIIQPQTLSISLKDDQRTNSFLINNASNLNQDYCPEELKSFLAAHSYNLGEMSTELVLVNGENGFSEEQLPWMEKFIDLFTLVHQREQLQSALIHAQQELVDVSKSKAQFLANVSHEIRSPLNGVICMASLLQESELDEEQQELLGIIQFSAENITRIIQDLLDLTQLSTGKLDIRSEEFSLPEFFNGLVKKYRKDGEDRDVQFHCELQEGLEKFHGDPVRISQVISNLLNNAFKNTEKGQVYLSLRREEDNLVVVVSDTGVGIPEDKLEEIFDQFVQLHHPDKGKIGGVGLGLSIVKQLVELMGGGIEVRSRVNRGSSFIVKIPLTHGEAVQVSSPNPAYSPKAGEPVRILVAEDDAVNRLYLQTLLNRRGFSVEEAVNGSEAVKRCQVNHYHLVLMDVSMPVMDGLEATRKIRQFLGELPIIAVTAHAYEEDQKRIMESGMNGLVLKPIDEDILMSMIDSQLQLQ